METRELFRRILVGVDSEGVAADAVVQAWKLSRSLGSRLYLVHAVEAPAPLWPGVGRSELASMHASALARAKDQTLAFLTAALQKADIDEQVGDLLRVELGHPVETLLQKALELEVDLIVLGPHAKGSLMDFGNTARAILSRTTCPIWTQIDVPRSTERILVPVDFSDHSRRALEYAHALATRLEATVEVLYCFSPMVLAMAPDPDAVIDPSNFIDQERASLQDTLVRWVDEFPWEGVPSESRFVEGDASRKILAAAENNDLVVMGTHGRTGLSRFLLGSTAYRVLKQSTKPVLVIPNPSREWRLDEPRGKTRASIKAHQA